MSRLKVISILFLLIFFGVSTHAQKKKGKNKNQLNYLLERRAEEQFITGMKFYMIDEYDKALISFNKAYSIDPENTATNYQIAHILENTYNFDLALPYAEYAYENSESNPYFYITLGNIYVNLNRLKDAAKIYEKLIKKFDNQEDYLFELAELYTKINEPDKAIELLDKFSKNYGVLEEVVMFKQKIFLRENQLEKALTEGGILIEMNPHEPLFIINQVKLLEQLGKKDERKALLEKFLKNNESSKLRLMLFEIQLASGDVNNANENYLKAFNSSEMDYNSKIDLIAYKIRDLPKDAVMVDSMCKTLCKQFPNKSKSHAIYGDYYQLMGEKAQSQNKYVLALKYDHSNFNIWQQLILIDAELESYDSLISHSSKALELFPNQGIFWYFNGSANLMKKNHDEAVVSFEKAKKLSFGNLQLLADINAQLGDSYNAIQKFEKSDMAYDEALIFNAENAHVLNNYSYFLSLRNVKLEKALSMSKKLIDQSPENKTYLDTRAWVLYKNKDYPNALILLEKASLDNLSGDVLEHYGDVLFKLNRIDEAVEQWSKAKKFGAKSKHIDNKIRDKKLYE